MGRIDQGRSDFVLCGVLEAPHEGRLVDMRITRQRLQSLVINLAADSGLFPVDEDATETDQVNRLRMLAHLGVPHDQARRMCGFGAQ